MTLVSLMLVHWFGDFILQNAWMANNKSRSWLPLGVHCSVYFITLLIWAMFVLGTLLPPPIAFYFAAGNAVAHFMVDAITSRMTTWAYSSLFYGRIFLIRF
jgi:hypothetical protein